MWVVLANRGEVEERLEAVAARGCADGLQKEVVLGRERERNEREERAMERAVR